MDLRNLPEFLRNGQRLDDGSKAERATILTPIGQAQYVRLSQAKASDKNPRKTWGLTLTFNHEAVASGSDEAHVNLEAVLTPCLAGITKAVGAFGTLPTATAEKAMCDALCAAYGRQVGYCIYRGWLRAGDEEGKRDDDGNFRTGFGPGRVFLSANRYADDTESNPPIVRDGAGAECARNFVKSGNLVRCVVDIYWSEKGTRICYGLNAVQYLAKGTPFEGNRGSVGAYASALAAVEGAEAVSTHGDAADDEMWGGY